MTDRLTLTARYLDEVVRRGATAAELRGRLPESDFLNSYYGHGYLSRPVFIGQDELDQVHGDLQNVHAALVRLPGLLCGGDLAAFARDLEETGYPVTALLRGWSGQVSKLARADLYATADGFRLLEYNMGSALGGLENADMSRAMLEHPVLAGFAAEHKLGYVDSMREQVSSLLAEAGLGAEPGLGAAAPVVAVTDWPVSYQQKLGRYMRHLAVRWREFGLDAHACHIGELEPRGGRVWLRGRAVDVIARMFPGDWLLDPQAPALIEPVLDAVARGEVQMFTPLDAELFGAKGALAMLSDDRHRHLFSAAELASFDRILPWTRIVRPGMVALEDRSRVDLLDYAVEHAGDLMLKPTGSSGGEGVVLGWHPAISPRQWREALTGAMAGSYVIQRRVRPEPELFPGDDGELVPWIITWGMFTGVNGYAGCFARGLRVDSGHEVINLGQGAAVGGCLSARPGSG